MSSDVRIFGAGDWGLAIGLHLAERHDVDVFIRNNKKYLSFCKKFNINDQSSISVHESDNGNWSDLPKLQGKSFADIIACSSTGFFELLNTNVNYFSKCESISWLTKGIDNHTGKLFHEVVSHVLGNNIDMCILSGPSFARDLIDNKKIEISIASNKNHLIEKISKLISADNFSLVPTSDIIGVQIAGIIKNIAATLTGILSALDYEERHSMLIIEKAKEEILKISSGIQAKPGLYNVDKSEMLKTLESPACHGDLILTCLNDVSRNRQFGYRIGKGESINSVLKDIGTVESFSATKTLYDNKEKFNFGEITDSIYKILYKDSDPKDIIKKIIN